MDAESRQSESAVGDSALPTTPARNLRGILLADRLIPFRPSNEYEHAYASIETPRKAPTSTPSAMPQESTSPPADTGFNRYQLVLQNEILGVPPTAQPQSMTPDTPVKRLSRPRSVLQYSATKHDRHGVPMGHVGSVVSTDSRQLLCAPQKTPRRIPKVPFKVLDAPDLQDDFYLNLVDWSRQNVISVALGSSVYLYNTQSAQVTKLCDLVTTGDLPTAVNWLPNGQHLAVGTHAGTVQLWDVNAQKKVRSMRGHTRRVAALASRSYHLASGGRESTILMRDVRSKDQYTARLHAHTQEVCGLKWSGDRGQLASGGNDNKVFVWNAANWGQGPAMRFAGHQAAVKAIAWSPHQRGLLASGGGTSDMAIRFWDTQVGVCRKVVHTGSQVCNLAWSKTSHELVSTHGYQENQIVIWKYPSMTQIANLTGHTHRVLYLAMSPDGQNIVTGAGDESLRFWEVFKPLKTRMEPTSKSVLLPYNLIR